MSARDIIVRPIITEKTSVASADNNTGANFLTVGPKGIVRNRKNKGAIEKKRISIWRRIKKFLNI